MSNPRKIKSATPNGTSKPSKKASEIFKLRTGIYPETLKRLTEMQQNPRIPALLDEKVLLDPWGRPYKYDPKMLTPMTNAPLIWSEEPNPKDATGKITIWAPQPPDGKRYDPKKKSAVPRL
jgi:Type II secretion system (T2SS), protein G